MKALKKIVILVLALLCIQIPSFADVDNTTVPAAWNLTFETNDVLHAARQACLMYNGTGHWKDAEFQTVGLHIFSRKDSGDQITLQLYAAHKVYKVNHGEAKEVAGSLYPVQMTFVRGGDMLHLTNYQTPRDGDEYGKDIKSMFGKRMANDIAKNSGNYAKSAENDAIAIAEQYIAASEGERYALPVIIFLKSGTNEKASSVIEHNISGWYPWYPGKAISYLYGTMYILTVEEEQSFSGVLTYESFNTEGERLTYAKVQVDGEKLTILDGELPSLYDE